MKHVVLLRGINVGGHNKLKMAALREALTDAGFDGVQTYIQSGNIVVESADSSDVVGERVRALLNAKFDLEVPVVTRTGAEWKTAIVDNPTPEREVEPKRFLVYFCDGEPEAADFTDHAPDQLIANGRELYVWYESEISKSKLVVKVIEKRTGVTATARNWSTVMKIADML